VQYSGIPIVGASVRVSGTQIGAATTEDGRYTILRSGGDPEPGKNPEEPGPILRIPIHVIRF